MKHCVYFFLNPKPNIMNKFLSLQPKQKRSSIRIFFGIVSIVIAIGLPVYTLINGASMDSVKWIFMFLFTFQGVIYLLMGLGISLPELFGKKTYLIIDETEIRFKTSNYEKETTVATNQIKRIEINVKHHDFILKDDQVVEMYVTGFEYQLLQDIKALLTEFAKENGVEILNSI